MIEYRWGVWRSGCSGEVQDGGGWLRSDDRRQTVSSLWARSRPYPAGIGPTFFGKINRFTRELGSAAATTLFFTDWKPIDAPEPRRCRTSTRKGGAEFDRPRRTRDSSCRIWAEPLGQLPQCGQRAWPYQRSLR